jgi:hypothetical protein
MSFRYANSKFRIAQAKTNDCNTFSQNVKLPYDQIILASCLCKVLTIFAIISLIPGG